MRLAGATATHLSYCSNIHAGEAWPEVRASLGRYLPAVKESVSPNAEFGVGLRLAAVAAEALRDAAVYDEFRGFLADAGLYIFTLNGFPYGVFHGARVKEGVYRPDWRTEERVQYTNLLADLFIGWLPENGEIEGSISTVPGGFQPDIASAAAVELIGRNMVRHVAHLVRLHRRTGKIIALALEPEPCCFIETMAEAVAFFRDHLFATSAIEQLMAETGLDRSGADAALHRHIGICLDLCHAAVEFEDPAGCVEAIRGAGIAIPKVQLSAGLRIPRVTPEAIEQIGRFNDDVYLHQVVEQTEDGLNRFVDLPPAIDAFDQSGPTREWRVHFHVPIFLGEMHEFATTRDFLEQVLAVHRNAPISHHLEVETYTFDVLPAEYRTTDVVTNIVRELEWAKQQLVR